MRRLTNWRVAAVAALLASGVPLPAQAPPDPGHAAEVPALIVTINPEGRVGVVLGAHLPAPAPRGTPVDLTVKIVNQGYATGKLEARLVGEPVPSAVLDFHPDRLKGSPVEMRTLRITLTGSAPTDLTIAFRLSNQVPDEGGRNMVHLLMRPL